MHLFFHKSYARWLIAVLFE